jgi:menaquinol-cytochrome c reductase iron-sulfur subunit
MQTDVVNGSRRGFMAGAIYGILTLMGAALGVPALLYLGGRSRTTKPSRWVDAGDISSVPAGSPHEISFRRNRIDGWAIHSEKDTAWIIKNQDASVTAFSPSCTHLGCAYRWEALRSQFICPCHGSLFSKNGDVIAGPAPRPLDRYEVKMEGKRLWLGAVNTTKVS